MVGIKLQLLCGVRIELAVGSLTYSDVPITRAGSIKQAGWIFHDFFLIEQVLIRASRMEKCIFSLIKW